jgi:N-acetylglucosamine kinase-like BadF-type ATPase
MSEQLLIAVDGGNSKTDLALLNGDGALLALVRGAGSSPHHLGTSASIELIGELRERAYAEAGLENEPADVAVLFVAGADLESEEAELRAIAESRGWADLLEVGNDTLAVLRAGSDSGFGVAVVCGAGINALARGPGGREVRFPALGAITGDWGGGADLGMAALGKAVRADDGRGRETLLARLVPEHFSMASAEEVAFAIHAKELEFGRLVELAPVVLDAADAGDAPAIELRERLSEEIVGFVRAAAGRALADVEHYDVVLGGSLLAGSASLGELVLGQLRAALPAADPRVSVLPPVVGSALAALDLLGAAPEAAVRLRDSFTERLGPVVLTDTSKGAST